MPLSVLSCATLGQLNHGFAEGIIDEALKNAVKDLDERGTDGKVRKVVITVSLERVSDNAFAAVVETQVKTPPSKIEPTICNGHIDQTKKQLVLEFRGDNPTNPNQPTLDDVDPHTGEVK